MNTDDRLTRIRESEKNSHIETYTKENLYDKNSWLQKPIKTVRELIPLFGEYKELRVLDLDCGIGRNSICIAETYQNITCTVDCVDLLEIAIEKLQLLLEDIFSDWRILKTGVSAQEYDIPRNGIISHLDTNVVTYVARK